MKDSGIVRRVDDLGRIVIPKEIRKACSIREGDPLEIFYDKKAQTVTLKRYETDAERREKWVNEWHHLFLVSRAISKRVGNMTIVAWSNRIETACCRKGDTYDSRVGEAICMAKLYGGRIPEYI